MSFYIKSLFFAIPTFVFLISLEAWVAKKKGVNINRSVDMISSLSSGVTNTVRDGIKFSFVIISYSWLVESISIYKLTPIWLAVIIAFVVQDFSGYWMHALLGIPPAIFAVLGPLHLFMQFWYHTQLIGKLGFLEYIIVTPSHHRVHHAINPEYIDKNYSQILIIWDKLFGTFQPELESVKPVYGTLKPMKTWNPIIINFKHFCHLLKDAWHTKSIFDKIKIWFMPTGWRPDDVKEKFPIEIINDPDKQIKYETKNSPLLISWGWIQLTVTNILMFHFFIITPDYSNVFNSLYASVIILNIFSFTSLLDHRKYAFIVESVKLTLIFGIFYYQNLNWYGLENFLSYGVTLYFILSFILTIFFLNDLSENSKQNTLRLF